jgi:hypothetical protein
VVGKETPVVVWVDAHKSHFLSPGDQDDDDGDFPLSHSAMGLYINGNIDMTAQIVDYALPRANKTVFLGGSSARPGFAGEIKDFKVVC